MTASYLSRFQNTLAALRGVPGLSITRAVVVARARGGDEPMSMEVESAARVGLLVDDTMCAVYDGIERIDIQWHRDERHYGSLVIPDFFDLEDAVVDPAGHGVAGQAAKFLLELHLIECLDALHWTAFRTPGLADGEVTGTPMELWVRIPGPDGRGPLDLPLQVDFAGYLERMLLTGGAEQWPLTLVADADVPAAARSTVAAALRRFLAAGRGLPGPALRELLDATEVRVAALTRSNRGVRKR